MDTIVRESVYVVRLGPQTHSLRIEELRGEGEFCEKKYRLRIPANRDGEGKTISTSSELEAALCGAEFLLFRAALRSNPSANSLSKSTFVQ